MTDNEIVKALECCGKNPPSCADCGYKGKCNRRDCYDYLKLDAFDLINRQKAEIEELKISNFQFISDINAYKAEIERLKEENKSLTFHLIPARGSGKSSILKIRLDAIKLEAYKEFAERLKTEYAKGMNWFKKKESYYVDVGDIDNLLKELVREDAQLVASVPTSKKEDCK